MTKNIKVECKSSKLISILNENLKGTMNKARITFFGLLPRKERYRLAMDRTNWKFGETNINVLTLAVIHDGVAFPLLISMLDKQGNSDTKERIEIIDGYTSKIHIYPTCIAWKNSFLSLWWLSPGLMW